MKRLLAEVAKPNGVASAFLIGLWACIAWYWLYSPSYGGAALSVALMVFCIGGYIGSLWANRTEGGGR